MDASDALPADSFDGCERIPDGKLYHVYEDPLEPLVAIYFDDLIISQTEFSKTILTKRTFSKTV